jgi:putative transposase
MTIYSDNGITEIGDGYRNHIKKTLLKIDSIVSKYDLRIKSSPSNKSLKLKKIKLMTKYYDKIKNKVNDIHWKICNYLTSSYKGILFGNFSTQSTNQLDGDEMTKRIGSAYSFYKLKEKLKYMCNYKKINYKLVDESFTSKCCSNCGNVHKNLKNKDIYECEQCDTIIGRDINGAKNIALVNL